MFYILQLYKENFMKISLFMGLRPFSPFGRSTEVLLSLRSVVLQLSTEVLLSGLRPGTCLASA